MTKKVLDAVKGNSLHQRERERENKGFWEGGFLLLNYESRDAMNSIDIKLLRFSL